jgi:hypothetical protein
VAKPVTMLVAVDCAIRSAMSDAISDCGGANKTVVLMLIGYFPGDASGWPRNVS